MLDTYARPTSSAVVFGHADGDGYLAAEVSRQNLIADGWIVSDVVVDPTKTPNYTFWENHFQQWDFSHTDLVVSVDIAFDFKNPTRSCEALSHRAWQFPDTRFLVIDHHPLTAGQWMPPNLNLVEADSAFRCCYGTPNDLMVIAAICDNEMKSVRHLASDAHATLAKGVARAATDVNGVAGERLLGLIERQQWAWLFELGQEPADMHRTVRRKRVTYGKSPVLKRLVGVGESR